MRLGIRNNFPRLCTGIAAVHVQFIAVYVKHTVTFEGQLQTTLVINDFLDSSASADFGVVDAGVAVHIGG